MDLSERDHLIIYQIIPIVYFRNHTGSFGIYSTTKHLTDQVKTLFHIVERLKEPTESCHMSMLSILEDDAWHINVDIMRIRESHGQESFTCHVIMTTWMLMRSWHYLE